MYVRAYDPKAERCACVGTCRILLVGIFMPAKHNSLLRHIILFGEDLYDAIGSFGAPAAVLLALLCWHARFPLAGKANRAVHTMSLDRRLLFLFVFSSLSTRSRRLGARDLHVDRKCMC